MTIADVKNRLFSHFMTDSTFVVEEDIAGLGITDEELGASLVPHRNTLVRRGLEELTKAGVLTELSSEAYVLTQPLDLYIQPVTVTPTTAEMVADLVDVWSEITNSNHTATKLTLQSGDIEAVCMLCHFLLEENRGPQRSTP